MLEETITLMERRENSVKTDIDVQTEDQDDEMMRCNECEYPAEDIYDLGEHMYEIHTLESLDSTIVCHHCGFKLKTKKELMVHRKELHKEKVGPCRYFLEGKCEFSDADCWFSHEKNNSGKKLQVYTCSFCGKVFKMRSDFMHHRKQEHNKNVPICKNELNGTCQIQNCWYNHSEIKMSDENNEDLSNQNQEIITKLFEMMETFTQRLVQIENNI